MPIKSFRGKAPDGAIETIHLSTNDGSTGYRITKFEAMGSEPGTEAFESILQIFSVPQTTASAAVDFSNQELLGVAIIAGNAAAFNYPYSQVIIFDNRVFNQDVYLTHNNTVGAGTDTGANWHIEMEQIKLSLDENTVATLKDIRNVATPTSV